MDFSNFSPAEQATMSRIIEQKQMKDFMRLYAGLVQRCFDTCCNDFTTRAVTTNEETCVDHCVLKFMKHSERVGARFQEENQKMMSGQK